MIRLDIAREMMIEAVMILTQLKRWKKIEEYSIIDESYIAFKAIIDITKDERFENYEIIKEYMEADLEDVKKIEQMIEDREEEMKEEALEEEDYKEQRERDYWAVQI